LSNPIIKTNHQPRPVIFFSEIPEAIRVNEFNYYTEKDYVGCFFKYKGCYYDVLQFVRLNKNSSFTGWDGIMNQSFFSGLLLKWCNNPDYVVIGRYCL
jgi:hypothetical protein